MNAQFRSEVAETTADLINRGVTDPRADEIADAHFGKAITSVMMASLRDQLPAIRDTLVEEYGMRAHIVNAYYYEHMRHDLPETTEEARHCLCIGRGNSADGIRVPTQENDLILQATIEHNIRSGAGKTSKNFTHAYKALMAGNLSNEQAKEIVEREKEYFIPLQNITKELHSRGALDGEIFGNVPRQLTG